MLASKIVLWELYHDQVIRPILPNENTVSSVLIVWKTHTHLSTSEKSRDILDADQKGFTYSGKF